jgi:hypothetical protein
MVVGLAQAQQNSTQIAPINVTTTTARQAFTTGAGGQAYLLNDGLKNLYYRLGDVTVVATSSDIPLMASCGVPIAIGTNTNVAAITATGTTTLRITQGSYVPSSLCADQTIGGKTITDHSGTITSGGVSQSLMAANATRTGCHIQNQSPTDLWFNPKGGTAGPSQPSTRLPPGADYVCGNTGASAAAFAIYGDTAGQAFVAEEW